MKRQFLVPAAWTLRSEDYFEDGRKYYITYNVNGYEGEMVVGPYSTIADLTQNYHDIYGYQGIYNCIATVETNG